jgi:hypothetical protein
MARLICDTLRVMDFFPCKADPDVWLKDCDTHYECLCLLMMMGKDPVTFFKEHTEKYKYNLRGVGRPSYHLGGDFSPDKYGTFTWEAGSYICKVLINYELMSGMKPKEARPLCKRRIIRNLISPPSLTSQVSASINLLFHPKLDLSLELDLTGIRQYQSLIGALQWVVSFGRFDILTGVATMGSFHTAPREGHLERLKRMYGYIKR